MILANRLNIIASLALDYMHVIVNGDGHILMRPKGKRSRLRPEPEPVFKE